MGVHDVVCQEIFVSQGSSIEESERRVLQRLDKWAPDTDFQWLKRVKDAQTGPVSVCALRLT